MSKFTIINYKKLVTLVLNLGYTFDRQKGSHNIYKNVKGNSVTLPKHTKDLKRGTLRKIIRDLGLTVPEYEELIKNL